MKSFILLIISIFTLQNINAQSLLDESNIWNVLVSGVAGPPFISTYRIKGEKEINSLIYVVLEKNDGDGWKEMNYYLRDGGDNKYYVVDGTGPEQLLYDFNLEVGDSFVKEFFLNNTCTGTVTSVDVITLNDGSERKRWTLSYPGAAGYDEEVWIEGIGSNLGLAFHNSSCYTDHPYHLICYWKGLQLEYTIDQTQCTLLSAAAYRGNGTINVNPNPFADQLKISSDGQIINSVEIYNSNGVVIKTINDIREEINTSEFASGVYVVKAITANQEVFVSKVIKQ